MEGARRRKRRMGEVVSRAVAVVVCLAIGMFAALVGLFAGIGGDV